MENTASVGGEELVDVRLDMMEVAAWGPGTLYPDFAAWGKSPDGQYIIEKLRKKHGL